MELRQPKSHVVSQETVSLHGFEYSFKIGTMHDESGVHDGFYLEVWSKAVGSEKIGICDSHYDSDVDYLKKLQRAAIEEEKAKQHFMRDSEHNLFRLLSNKIKNQERGKAKKKVFSIRFDGDLQTKFAETCRQSGRSQSEVVRVLMEGYIATGTFSSVAATNL